MAHHGASEFDGQSHADRTAEADRAVVEGKRQDAEALIEDLRSELAAIAEATAGAPDDEHDAEGSTIGYERARVSGLLAGAEEERSALDRALRRLGEGTYRRCGGCGGDIGGERLGALPSASLCVDCAGSGASGGVGRVR